MSREEEIIARLVNLCLTFIAEVPCSDHRFQGILDDGFGIVDISSFMQLIVDKQAGRQVFVANPGTNKCVCFNQICS